MVWRNQRGLANGAFELELGTIVVQHGIEIIEPALCQSLDGLQDLDRPNGFWKFSSLANCNKIKPERLDGFDQSLSGIFDLARPPNASQTRPRCRHQPEFGRVSFPGWRFLARQPGGA